LWGTEIRGGLPCRDMRPNEVKSNAELGRRLRGRSDMFFIYTSSRRPSAEWEEEGPTRGENTQWGVFLGGGGGVVPLPKEKHLLRPCLITRKGTTGGLRETRAACSTLRIKKEKSRSTRYQWAGRGARWGKQAEGKVQKRKMGDFLKG